MINRSWFGISIILLSGVFNGSFALPMKYSRQWKWENTWLIFCLVSLVILPWSLATGLTPEMIRVYREVPGRALLYPLAFGFLWGIAQVTFGIGIDAVGMALTFAVVMGLACLFGSLIPLLVLTPGDLQQARGLLLLVSMPVLFLGLIFCGVAGKRREKETAGSGSPSRMSYLAGLAICIFTGVFGANLNLGFAFSGAIISTSQALGANAVTSTYPVWALVLGAGFVPNLIYCGYLLLRNHSWALFERPGWGKETVIGIAMGVLWFAGIDCYGVGATLVGKQGTSVGFALFLAVSILSSNILGVLTGEWKATSRATKRQLAVGVAIVVVAVVILNLSGFF
jgi:L-rhamnose-H+ transport protein